MRLGWEFDISTGPWGAGVNGNTPALYVSAWEAVVPAMLAVNSTLQVRLVLQHRHLDAQPTPVLLPGRSYVDYIGGDHYDNIGGGGDSSQYGACVNLASSRGKPLSSGEWGLNGTDDPTWINDRPRSS